MRHYKRITTHKRCSLCNELLERNSDNFWRNKKSYDGYQTRCKRCAHEYQVKYIQMHGYKKPNLSSDERAKRNKERREKRHSNLINKIKISGFFRY